MHFPNFQTLNFSNFQSLRRPLVRLSGGGPWGSPVANLQASGAPAASPAPTPAGETYGHAAAGDPEVWGAVAFVKTYGRIDREHSGYQVVCHHPGHARSDGNKCQKSRNIKSSGGVENCKRLLQTWVLWGLPLSSADEHSEIWKDVLEAFSKGTLPSSEDLEGMAFDDWTAAAVSYGYVLDDDDAEDFVRPKKRARTKHH